MAIISELGGRLAFELGLLVGRDALLSRAKRAVPADVGTVRVLGIDDFASRRGARYGTILVDLERRRIMDLFPERSRETLVAWLGRHPEVETVTRHRSNIYREALAKGAPGATQIADRWLRLHQRLPRHRQRHGDHGGHRCLAPEDRRRAGRRPELRGRLPLHLRRHHSRGDSVIRDDLAGKWSSPG